ncbi:MAG: ATP-binding cassette domain-containing protein [Gammaproteobacteria bacterium]
MSHTPLLIAKQLNRHFAQHHAVNNLSFELSRGEVLGFLGPNGAGKSTTMRMLTGNLAPSAGSITINGIDLLEQPAEAKAHLGYLPEQPPLYRELTINEYLIFCAQLHRVPENKISVAIDETLQRCGLTDNCHRLIGNLSKGYQQRVGIAQAIVHNPSIVILDEPTVGLDPIQIRDIRQLIRELGEDHAVILSTHILPEVQATCSRVQIINEGQLVFSESIQGLEKRLTKNVLTLETAKPMDNEMLQAIPHIKQVNRVSDTRAELSWETTNPADAISLLVAEKGWGLQELALSRRSLEQVFVELTCNDNQTKAAT